MGFIGKMFNAASGGGGGVFSGISQGLSMGTSALGMFGGAAAGHKSFQKMQKAGETLLDKANMDEMKKQVQDGLKSIMYKGIQKSWDNFMNNMQLALNMKTTIS